MSKSNAGYWSASKDQGQGSKWGGKEKRRSEVESMRTGWYP